MNQSEGERFAIVDIETTGMSAGKGSITEIAILVFDGQNLVDEFVSLVNPERQIPYFITKLTGINNQMVAGAPRFYEIARRIIEITEGCTIVGHNVKFDYSFLRAEFKSLGYDYQRKTLDTVRLARKLLPGMPGYSLGKLCNALNISNVSQHRAAGDAMATLELFRMLRNLDPHLKSSYPHEPNHRQIDVSALPELPGVYMFYDTEGRLIYVGKSVNIRSRVMQHLSNNSTRKALELRNSIAEVSFEHTGNELIALLLESELIKTHQPLYNRRQRRALFNYGLFHYIDEQGYVRLKLGKTTEKLIPDLSYTSYEAARGHLFQLTEKYHLCQKLNGLYSSHSGCFQYQIGLCNGACVGKEPPEVYNQRALAAVERYHFEHDSFILVLKGRTEDEVGLVRIMNGVYAGFGYVSVEDYRPMPEVLAEFIVRRPDNRDVRQIIRSYMRKSKNYLLIPEQKEPV